MDHYLYRDQIWADGNAAIRLEVLPPLLRLQCAGHPLRVGLRQVDKRIELASD
jgi:hypothetical protein